MKRYPKGKEKKRDRCWKTRYNFTITLELGILKNQLFYLSVSVVTHSQKIFSSNFRPKSLDLFCVVDGGVEKIVQCTYYPICNTHKLSIETNSSYCYNTISFAISTLNLNFVVSNVIQVDRRGCVSRICLIVLL